LWGNYNCDPPIQLGITLFETIQLLKPDFILYTGDDVAHDIWEQSRLTNLKSINSTNALLRKYFPNIPVFSALGNHESFPVNMFAGPGKDNWLLDVVTEQWSHYTSTHAQTTVKYGGYYTERVRPGLRVISLNTNMYSQDNLWLLANFTDVSYQLNWLNDVLQQTQEHQEKAIIIGHAGCQEWYSEFCILFLQLLMKYRACVVGLFFGHTHTTSINVLFDTDQKPFQIAYLAGSVTMINGVNPTFRMNEYDRSLHDPFIVKDFVQYWLDMNVLTRTELVNLTETDFLNIQQIPRWLNLSYTPSSEYDLKDLSPESWSWFANDILRNETLYERYVNNYVRQSGMWNGGQPSAKQLHCDIISPTAQEDKDCCNLL
jgi:sphingomyelin phosphodiesterase